MGTPTVENFEVLLRQNIMQNCPITVEDIIIAEDIFGPDTSSPKGKSMRSKPKPVRKDLIKIPTELIMKHKNLELCTDTMFVNECGMSTGIDRSIKFRSLVPIDTKQHEECCSALDVISRHHDSTGFRTSATHCDRKYEGMMDKIKDELDIDVNFTNADDHAPEAECNN